MLAVAFFFTSSGESICNRLQPAPQEGLSNRIRHEAPKFPAVQVKRLVFFTTTVMFNACPNVIGVAGVALTSDDCAPTQGEPIANNTPIPTTLALSQAHRIALLCMQNSFVRVYRPRPYAFPVRQQALFLQSDAMSPSRSSADKDRLLAASLTLFKGRLSVQSLARRFGCSPVASATLLASRALTCISLLSQSPNSVRTLHSLPFDRERDQGRSQLLVKREEELHPLALAGERRLAVTQVYRTIKGGVRFDQPGGHG